MTEHEPMLHTNPWDVTPRRHDADGHVYLAYFRKDQNLGFVWDGNVEHPIQVTHEMGESVIDTFHIDLPPGMTFPQLLQHFQIDCDAYAHTHEEV